MAEARNIREIGDKVRNGQITEYFVKQWIFSIEHYKSKANIQHIKINQVQFAD